MLNIHISNIYLPERQYSAIKDISNVSAISFHVQYGGTDRERQDMMIIGRLYIFQVYEKQRQALTN
jgi:hypothetical protein